MSIRAADSASRPLGSTGLQCHCLGFGCYRVHRGHAEHEAALRSYLDRGGNLIDTSANYADGLSESLVGQVLQDYPRKKVIVVTKGGYIQGRNMELARQRHFPEVVHYGEGIWHCIHPDFLEEQISLSLDRLRLEFADAYLLHNPEYFLTDKAHFSEPSAADREEFYRRVREAFRFLETEVDRGRLRMYGISSNNFPAPSTDGTMTSISRCLEEARSLSSAHHFRLVQLPLNLYEPNAALEPNNHGMSALEFCRREGLAVLVNRPLNAFAGNRLIRLADFVQPGQALPGLDDLRRILSPLREKEQELALELGVKLAGGVGIAGILEQIVPQLHSPDDWERAAGSYVVKPMQVWLNQMQARFSGDMRWQAWFEELGIGLKPLFEEIVRFLAAKQQDISDGVRSKLLRAGYPGREESLSQMALRVLLQLEGVSSVLVGMRRRSYVEDSFMAIGPPAFDSLEMLRRFPDA